jgi:hypothetical protein
LSVENLSPRSFRLRTAAIRLPRKLSVKAAAPSLHCLLCLFPIVYVTFRHSLVAGLRLEVIGEKATSEYLHSTTIENSQTQTPKISLEEEEEKRKPKQGSSPLCLTRLGVFSLPSFGGRRLPPRAPGCCGCSDARWRPTRWRLSFPPTLIY